jgi:hypothetical protein
VSAKEAILCTSKQILLTAPQFFRGKHLQSHAHSIPEKNQLTARLSLGLMVSLLLHYIASGREAPHNIPTSQIQWVKPMTLKYYSKTETQLRQAKTDITELLYEQLVTTFNECLLELDAKLNKQKQKNVKKKRQKKAKRLDHSLCRAISEQPNDHTAVIDSKGMIRLTTSTHSIHQLRLTGKPPNEALTICDDKAFHVITLDIDRQKTGSNAATATHLASHLQSELILIEALNTSKYRAEESLLALGSCTTAPFNACSMQLNQALLTQSAYLQQLNDNSSKLSSALLVTQQKIAEDVQLRATTTLSHWAKTPDHQSYHLLTEAQEKLNQLQAWLTHQPLSPTLRDALGFHQQQLQGIILAQVNRKLNAFEKNMARLSPTLTIKVTISPIYHEHRFRAEIARQRFSRQPVMLVFEDPLQLTQRLDKLNFQAVEQHRKILHEPTITRATRALHSWVRQLVKTKLHEDRSLSVWIDTTPAQTWVVTPESTAEQFHRLCEIITQISALYPCLRRQLQIRKLSFSDQTHYFTPALFGHIERGHPQSDYRLLTRMVYIANRHKAKIYVKGSFALRHLIRRVRSSAIPSSDLDLHIILDSNETALETLCHELEDLKFKM